MENHRQLYIEFLNEIVTFNGKQRARVRYPKQYQNIVGTDSDECIDLTTTTKRVFIWSDTHFGHQNIIKFANRPFADKIEMDEQLVANHNRVVSDDDICIWLGDVAFMNDTKANEILNRCNGYKILIVGNHDMNRKKLKKLNVNEVHLTYKIQTSEYCCILSHYPMTNLPWPVVNIHGHSHDREEQSVQHINVSVEHLNYTPVPLATILNTAHSRALEMIG